VIWGSSTTDAVAGLPQNTFRHSIEAALRVEGLDSCLRRNDKVGSRSVCGGTKVTGKLRWGCDDYDTLYIFFCGVGGGFCVWEDGAD